MLSGQLTVASLNTRGVPMTGSGLARRYAMVGAGYDGGDADVVCFQDVFTYWHLRLVTRLARPGWCVINTHPVANKDGDWSEATGDGVTTETAALVFAGKEPLAPAPGYVSDHIGLHARLSLAPEEAR